MRSEALCPGIVDDDLSTGSLHRLLHIRCSLVVARGERSLEAVAAGPWEARVCDAALGSSLLLLDSVVSLPALDYPACMDRHEAYEEIYDGNKRRYVHLQPRGR
jgi:DNA-binding GntR family transcriptional regulator